MKKANTIGEWEKSLEEFAPGKTRYTLDASHLTYKSSHEFRQKFKQLASIDGFPETFTTSCRLDNNIISTLKGGPKHVDISFIVNNNLLTNLEGAPRYVGNHFSCAWNKIKSLHNVHKLFDHIGGDFVADQGRRPLKECILGVFLIPGCTQIYLFEEGTTLQNIIAKYELIGKAGLYKCAQELITAGFSKLAKL